MICTSELRWANNIYIEVQVTYIYDNYVPRSFDGLIIYIYIEVQDLVTYIYDMYLRALMS